jgi:Cu+-exporting ATPase
MDSLITLGTVSAFSMAVMLMVVYELEERENAEDVGLHMRLHRIMNITHMFESTALILTVITIGKYFEGRAK